MTHKKTLAALIVKDKNNFAFLKNASPKLRKELEEMREKWWQLSRSERVGVARIVEILERERGFRVPAHQLRAWLAAGKPAVHS